MKEKHFDEKVKQFLLDETDEAVKNKEKVWDELENSLFNVERKRSKKKRLFVMLTAAALFIIVWTGLSTSTGQALVQSIKDMFVEEKIVDIEIEGDQEQTDMNVEINEELQYVIYIDETRYKLVKEDNIDRIVPKEELGESYPTVAMEIWREEASVDEVIQLIEADMNEMGMTIKRMEETNEPIGATMMIAYGEEDPSNYEWDTPIYRFYITDEIDGQLFVIKQMYFLEAAEGHGVRFDAMLNEFEIYKE